MGKAVFYLCDGDVDGCLRSNCYKNGGECRHTSDVYHARNFRKLVGEGAMFEMGNNKKDAKEGLLAAFLIKIRRFLSRHFIKSNGASTGCLVKCPGLETAEDKKLPIRKNPPG